MPKEYPITLNVYGLPAYALERLPEIGILGDSPESVLEFIMQTWMFKNQDRLKELGITIEAAEKAEYVPVTDRKCELDEG